MNNAEHIRYKKNNTSTTFLTIFDNPRIQLSLEQLSHNSSTIHTTSRSSIKDKNCQNLSKIDKENSINRQRQTFRSFARMRRSYKTSGDRKNYIDLKQQMERLAKFLENNCNQIELSRFLELKQKIMLGFLNELINDLSQQNLDKAELLVVIWNNLFLLAQKSMEKICQFSNSKEKIGLEEQVDTHNKYQKILESYLKQREQMKQQKAQKQHFMRILVAKIRQYKKTMKKMEQTLRIAADKLNQFRRDYLQVQIQCINLTMELKNVGQKTAKEMVCKKMALILQKSKQYKFLPSKKKMRKQRIQNRIKTDEKENVAIKEQFYEAFLSSMSQKPEDFVKHVWRAIETIIDKEEHEDINYSIFNENLIQSYQEEKMDQSTDMAGFFIEKEDKKVGIDPKQRFCFEMTKMKGVQTITIEKPPQIKNEEIGLQCNFNNIRTSKFNMKRSFDLSFLFQNTLKKTSFKNQQIGLVFASNANFKKKSKIQREHVQLNLDQQIKQEPLKLQLPEPILQLEVEKLQETNLTDLNQEIEKNDPYRLDIKKKIKKIPSTFHNKITMLSGFLNFHKSPPSKSVHESKIEGENDKAKIQDTNLTIISQRNNEEHQRAEKSNKKIKFEQKDEQSVVFSKSNKRIEASQSFKNNSEKNLVVDKKSDQRKMYKNSKSGKSSPPRRGTPAKQVRQKSVKMERNQKDTQISIGVEIAIPRNSEKERSAKFTNVIKKQFDIDVKQFYYELEQELEKNKGRFVESTNKHSSRVKGLIKTIDTIFQAAAKDYETNNKLSKRFIIYAYQSIFNLYGIGNTNYIQKRVISFIQEIYQFRETSTILSLFLMMLGLAQNGSENEVYSEKNTQIIIKLTKSICANWKYPFKFSELSLNLANIQQNIQQQLKKSGFCDQFIFNLSSHIRESTILSSKHVQPSHILFSILKYITQRQNIISISYEPILNIICSSSTKLIPTQFIPFLIELHYFSTRQVHKMQNEFQIYLARNNIEDGIDRASWAYFCTQNQILDFSRLFHRILNIFKLKQGCPLLQNIELERITKTKSSLRSLPQKIVSILMQNCLKMNDKNAFFHAVMKKNVLAILYLKMKDEAAHKIVNGILGNQLLVFNEVASNLEQCWS